MSAAEKLVERVARSIQTKLDGEFEERGGLTAEEMADMAARAAIAECVAVLIEPDFMTDAMLDAGDAQHEPTYPRSGEIFRAMLAASPLSKEQGNG